MKSVIAQFICTAILPLIASRIFNSQMASRTGLVFEMTVLIIFYGLIINVLSLIYPKAVLRALRRIKYNSKMPQETVDKFQVQLNHEFQYVKFDMINRYVNYLTLLFTAVFYAYMIPVTVPLLVLIFFLQYWLDKLNLFRRSSLPRNFGFILTRHILKLFESSIFVFGVGTYILGTFFHSSLLNILNLVTLGVALLYLWFLVGSSLKLERKVFGSYESSQSALYDDCGGEGKFE
jgi:hypothetical protein